MINRLIGTDGLRAAQSGADSWILYGHGQEISELELQLQSLRAAINAIRIPDDHYAELLALIQSVQNKVVGHGTATLNFGAFPGSTEVRTTVSAIGMTANKAVIAWPDLIPTADHTVNEVCMEEFQCEVTDLAPGAFDMLVRPRVGLSFGTYRFNYLYL